MSEDEIKTPWYAKLTPGELERRVEALPALAAVASAVLRSHPPGGIWAGSCEICRAIYALDAAHPGWREWTA